MTILYNGPIFALLVNLRGDEMRLGITRRIKQASKDVKQADVRKAIRSPIPENENFPLKRNAPVPGAKEVKELPPKEALDHGSFESAANYVPIEVESSKGKRYSIMIPKSYINTVPKKWAWNGERYRVAELIAMGIPIAQIPDDPEVHIKSRMIIYGWLQHPEFKEHVDGITLETGFANKRERIAQLNRLTRELFTKVIRGIDSVPLTDKSIGPILTAIQTTAKLIAQEKEEFIEEAKITQDTNITGTITNVHQHVHNLLDSKTTEERKALEKTFDEISEDIIRAITGDKSTEFPS